MISFKIEAVQEYFFLDSDMRNNFPLNDSKVFNQHVCFCEFIFHKEQKQNTCMQLCFFLFVFCTWFPCTGAIAPFTASIKQIKCEYKWKKSSLFLTLFKEFECISLKA